MAECFCRILKTVKCIPVTVGNSLRIMPKASNGAAFYAVRVGKNPGIYLSWDECQKEVMGYPKARYKKFPTREQAEEFILEGGLNPGVFSQVPVPTPSLAQAIAQNIAQNIHYPQTSQWSTSAPTLVQNSPYFQAGSLPTQVPPPSSVYIQPAVMSPSKKMSQLRTFCTDISDTTSLLEQHLLKGNEIVNTLTVMPYRSEDSRRSEILHSFNKLLQKADGHVKSLQSLIKQGVIYAKNLDACKRPLPPDENGDIKAKRQNIHMDMNMINAGASGSSQRVAEVYTDGCCHNNGKSTPTAGIGVFWGPQHPNNISERLLGRQTNNRAEIQAARAAVKQAKNQGYTKIIINTDSQFMINCMTMWIHKWKKNGWLLATGKPVINKKDVQRMDDAMFGIQVEWRHVKGHSGVYGNEEADKLANDGARKPYIKEDSESDFEYD